MKVLNKRTNEQADYDAAVILMNDDLREQLHAELAPCTEQEFFDEYIELHFERYGEEFTV